MLTIRNLLFPNDVYPIPLHNFLHLMSKWAPCLTVLPTQAKLSQVTKSKLASAGHQPVSRASSQENMQLFDYDRAVTKP